ncbi:isoquinoline 1-oxidoreductase subunit beta [Novimethylophilus kurashikiensis]|uniref:Isoquinoline 1-oxidoreductase subunit beta n=1 Tax=Novimethylophilus kurashikiensis TaxID=1825523 RepID=A0A2R5F1I9_9PROT|nr:xanthine dehydrogenase family protein molybdopterin-binding subunit [Novimethylophilus kurashikiensis]GBG12577.1 isoquinoline 1-oxidoreductase subunit beta [Novimethylophilus kurashikiensis]
MMTRLETELPALPETGLARREFLIATAGVGGGLVLGFLLPRVMGPQAKHGAETSTFRTESRPFVPNAFIRVDPDGLVTLTVHKVEMGQGTFTSIPMLVAEEMDIDLAKVKLEQAPADDKKYADPILGSQVTGGSTSIRGAWKPLREAGAMARILLLTAASKQWNVPLEECTTSGGMISHGKSGKTVSYGEVAGAAALLPIPQKVQLKDPQHYRLIGTPAKRLDTPSKVNGQAKFGIDAQVPNMKIATVAASPILGGKLTSVDDSKARSIKGVVQVVKLEDAVAVVADHMWAAKQGLAALDIKWDGGRNASLDIKDIVGQLQEASNNQGRAAPGVVARSVGDFRKTFEQSKHRFEATYQVPFLSQAGLEPMNCTVHVQPDRCDIWVGTQVPTLAQAGAMTLTKLPAEKIFIHNHYIGGGFGRRLDVDFINQAVAIAKQLPYPVKVVWTREEDMQHGIYRPYYYDKLSAALDDQGKPIAWSHRVTGSSVMSRWVPQMVENGLDPDAVEGARDPLYARDNLLVEYIRQEPPGIVTGWWRGVGVTHNMFMIESFIDELAHLAKQDPLAYRLSQIDHVPRAKAVLQLAADKAGWGGALPQNQGRGLSVQFAFGSYVAQVAEVEVGKDDIRVKRVVCAVDCGTVVNPDTVVAQMEGGIIFGISGALYDQITVKQGRVEQSNFDNYRVLRMNEAPVIEVHLIRNNEAPGGVGEPGTAAVAPAIANAVFAATGKRIRTLPLVPSLMQT